MILLGDIADIQMGYPFRSRLEHDPQGDIAVIQMKDIDETTGISASHAVRLSLPGVKERHLLRPGDLLFKSRGVSNGVAQVGHAPERSVLAAPMLLIRPHAVDPAYLCWYLNAPSTQAQLASLSEGTSVRMISADALKTLGIPVPERTVQGGIARTAELVNRERALLARLAEARLRLNTELLMQSARESKP